MLARINAAYLERKLRSAVGLAGGEVLKEPRDLNGLVTLESDRPEWRAAANEMLAGGDLSLAAGGAGNFSQIALENPLNSGLIAVVTGVQVSGTVFLRAANSAALAGFATAGSLAFRDVRLGFDAAGLQVPPGMRIRALAAAGIAGFVFDRIPNTPFNLYLELINPIAILTPGFALNIQHGVANTALDASFLWYERPLEGKWEIK